MEAALRALVEVLPPSSHGEAEGAALPRAAMPLGPPLASPRLPFERGDYGATDDELEELYGH